jgi:hypothetical protein
MAHGVSVYIKYWICKCSAELRKVFVGIVESKALKKHDD